MIFLLTGGSKSGKSSLAEHLCLALRGAGPMYYLATMRVVDEEDRAVVRRHQRMREGRGFLVKECAQSFGKLLVAPDAALLLEDLPNALANLMFGGGNAEELFPDIVRLARQTRHLILITNELDADGVRYDGGTERYIRALGALNCACARLADTVVEVVSGIPITLKGALP